jgi:putative flippase GtrA
MFELQRPSCARALAYHFQRPGPRQLLLEIGRLIRFGIVGIVVTLVYGFVTFALVSSSLANAVSATVIGHITAGLVSYFGHLRFSFAVNPEHRTFLWRFLVIAAAMFAVNIAITWLFTSVLGVSYVISIATVAILIPLMNYLCNRLWVFSPGLGPARAGETAKKLQGF